MDDKKSLKEEKDILLLKECLEDALKNNGVNYFRLFKNFGIKVNFVNKMEFDSKYVKYNFLACSVVNHCKQVTYKYSARNELIPITFNYPLCEDCIQNIISFIMNNDQA